MAASWRGSNANLTLERRRQEAEDARTGLPLLKWAEQCYSIRPSEPWVPVRYIADFMATVIAPDVRRVVLWKSSQVGATQAFTALHGWLVGEQDARVVVAMPTELEARKLYRRIISPLHERVDRLAKMQMALPDRRARAGPHRTFPTGAESLVQGATSADRYASFVADLLVLDELDRYPTLDEGDALTLSMRAVSGTPTEPWPAAAPPPAPTAQARSSPRGRTRTSCSLSPYPARCAASATTWSGNAWSGRRKAHGPSAPVQCATSAPSAAVSGHTSGCATPVAHGRWQEAELERGREFPSLVRDNPHYVTRHGTLRRGKRKADWPGERRVRDLGGVLDLAHMASHGVRVADGPRLRPEGPRLRGADAGSTLRNRRRRSQRRRPARQRHTARRSARQPPPKRVRGGRAGRLAGSPCVPVRTRQRRGDGRAARLLRRSGLGGRASVGGVQALAGFAGKRHSPASRAGAGCGRRVRAVLD